jgi:hypothetical protein
MSNTYSVVAFNQSTWSYRNGIQIFDETAHCGHNHKTIAAAEACMANLTEWRCLCGHTTSHRATCCGTPRNSTSARWYHSEIRDSDGIPVVFEEMS